MNPLPQDSFLFQTNEMMDYLALRLAESEHTDFLFFKILHLPFWKLSSKEIDTWTAEWSLSGKRWKIPLGDYLKEETKQAVSTLFNPEPNKDLVKVIDTIDHWARLATKKGIKVAKKEVESWIFKENTGKKKRREVPPVIYPLRLESKIMDALINRFSLSASALNDYINCPLSFYFNYILRAPRGTSGATEFGSAVHYALEQLFRAMQEGGKEEFPPVKQLIRNFEFYMGKHQSSFSSDNFKQRMEYGATILRKYYDHKVQVWNKIVSVERRFRNIVLGRVKMNGIIDKLEFDGSKVKIVDYKTGRISRERTWKRLERPSDQHLNGGNYWRQAVFYQLLIEHYTQKDWEVEQVDFDFVEPIEAGGFYTHVFKISNEEKDWVQNQIENSWKQIQQQDFYEGCGHCDWCRFVEANYEETP